MDMGDPAMRWGSPRKKKVGARGKWCGPGRAMRGTEGNEEGLMMERTGWHLGLSQRQCSISSYWGSLAEEQKGLGNVEGCGEEVGEEVGKWRWGVPGLCGGMLGGKRQQGSLTFVCNLASCFSSRLVCL